MMEKFTASNGYSVHVHPVHGAGTYTVSSRSGRNMIAGYEHLLEGEMQALREFFQHERDQELGRWRWPENPDYVVYLSEGGEAVWVLNERDAGMISFTREMSTPTGEDEAGYNGAARAYFAAHPEPKPWHDAKPGEVWVLDTQYGELALQVLSDGAFDNKDYYFDNDDTSIKAGRRIWPEVSDVA